MGVGCPTVSSRWLGLRPVVSGGASERTPALDALSQAHCCAVGAGLQVVDLHKLVIKGNVGL